MPKEHYVYILECADGTYYTGYTTDLDKRVEEHNTSKKGAKYTSGRRPVKLVYFEAHSSASAAKRREYRIKQYSRNFKEFLVKKSENVIF